MYRNCGQFALSISHYDTQFTIDKLRNGDFQKKCLHQITVYHQLNSLSLNR